jgi:hypothetical protein
VTIRSSSSVESSPALHSVSFANESSGTVCSNPHPPEVSAIFEGWGIANLLDDDVRVASTDTLDAGQGKHDLLFAVDIGVEETENVLEGVLVGDDESHGLSLEVVMSNNEQAPLIAVATKEQSRRP